MKKDTITRGLQLAKELNNDPLLARELGLTINAGTVGLILGKVECPISKDSGHRVSINHVTFEETKEDMMRKLGGKN